MLSLQSSVWFTTAIVAKMLNGLGGRFRSFRLGGIIVSCRPNPYAIVGSLESEWIVTVGGSEDVMGDIKIISRLSLPDNSMEWRTIGVFGLGRLCSFDDCSI